MNLSGPFPRPAKALEVLLAQLNTTAPRRSKASDGWIGDTAHQQSGDDSDHNPWWPKPHGGIVTARDFTHDPAGGLDCDRLAAALVASRDRRIKYIIWKGRILDTRAGFHPWTWQPYHGASPHDHHLHLSVMDSVVSEATDPWRLPVKTLSDRSPTSAPEDVVDRLAPTPPAGSNPDSVPDRAWDAVEETLATPGPVGGWRQRTLTHTVFGWGGGFVQEAWSGPSGKHYVTRYDPTKKTGGQYIKPFDCQSWELPTGDRFLVIRYAARAAGSIGIETQS